MILDLSENDWTNIKKLFLEGKTAKEIKQQFPNVTLAAIYVKNNKHWKISARKFVKGRRLTSNRMFTDEEELDIVNLYVKNYQTTRAIAKIYKCNNSTIGRILKHHKVKARKMKDYVRKTGEDSPRWRGGRAIFTKHGYRFTEEYVKWRLSVFSRDGFKCILCKSKENIQADHIKPKSKYPELIYDIDNGRTLCKKCHKNTDTYGAKVLSIERDSIESDLKNQTFKIKPLVWKPNPDERNSLSTSTYFGKVVITEVNKNKYAVKFNFEEFLQSKIIKARTLDEAKEFAENVWQGILLTQLEKC